MAIHVRNRFLRALTLGCLAIGLFTTQDAFAQTITIGNRSVSTTYSPLPGGTAYYVLSYDGNIVTSNCCDTYGSDVGDWISPKSGMSNYQVRATSSTCSGPATGTWLSLSVSQYWYKSASGPAPQSASCFFTIEISAVSNPSVILGSATISLLAYY